MAAIINSFICSIWWILFTALVTWLICRCLCGCKNKSNNPPAEPTNPNNAAKTSTIDKTTTVAESKTDSIQPLKATETKTAEKPATKAPAAKKTTPTKTAAKTPAKKATPKKAAPKVVAVDIAAAKAAGFKIKNADDLTVIEGIGPKINDLFKAAGLKTYADVAQAKVPQMRKILDEGGSRFRIANPGTWAKQAKLASTNKWTALKKLQDELSGGKEK